MSTDLATRLIRDDEPLMVAWEAHKKTDQFDNTLQWAGKCNMGQLWSCFVAGWIAAGGEFQP